MHQDLALWYNRPIFNQCSIYVETRQLVFTSKTFEKQPWKSDILSTSNVTLTQVFFKHFASKNQLTGLFVSINLVEDGLTSKCFKFFYVGLVFTWINVNCRFRRSDVQTVC